MDTHISFVWFGITGRYGFWKDGLWAAMKHLEKEYKVTYHEPSDDIDPNSIVLFWEAPCSFASKDGEMYRRIQNLPNKKILLFAGGPVNHEWVFNFDMVCVESQINKEEFENLGVPVMIAFGINEDIMIPKNLPKLYDGIHHGTSASWKRQWLLGEALKEKALIVGRYQIEDPKPFDDCRKFGAIVLDEKTPEELCDLINQSKVCVQTSNFWGGGQRTTLEAMACNVPVLCMEDSPKNREYVEESGFGAVCKPEIDCIRQGVEELKAYPLRNKGREYILSKWTSRHYADNIKVAINKI